jgi:uncharacterized delta-60 repeat protein
VTAGTTFNGHDEDVLLLRYTPEGKPDPSFGQEGVVTFGGSAGGDDRAYGVAVHADGKIAVVGTMANGHDQDLLLLRFLPDGKSDPSFGQGGVATYVRAAGNREVGRALAIQPDGKIVVVGESGEPGKRDALILRFATDGTLDPGFATAELAYYDDPGQGDDAGLAVALQPDGKVLLAGIISPFPLPGGEGGQEDLLLLRFTSIGALDPVFASGGIFTFDGPVHGTDLGNALALQPDGKILVAGATASAGGQELLLLRMTPQGILGPSFGQSGQVIDGIPGDVFDVALAVACQADGKIVVSGAKGGGSTEDGLKDALVLRFELSGKADAAFGKAGAMSFTGPETGDDWANALAIQPDGKIVVVGSHFWAGNDEALIMRLLP